jgi:hypothetical protein
MPDDNDTEVHSHARTLKRPAIDSGGDCPAKKVNTGNSKAGDVAEPSSEVLVAVAILCCRPSMLTMV